MKNIEVKHMFYPLNVEYNSESDCYNITASTGLIHKTIQVTREFLIRTQGSHVKIAEDIKRRLDNDMQREIHRALLRPECHSKFMNYGIIVDTEAEDGKGRLIVSPTDYHMMLKERFDIPFRYNEKVIIDWEKESNE